MRQMPYKTEPGAVEQAKYRAKMAVREVAHSPRKSPRGYIFRWAAVTAGAAAMLVLGLFVYNERQYVDYEDFVAEMQSAPDYIISELSIDNVYYPEDKNSL